MRLALLVPLAALLAWQTPAAACFKNVETTQETLARATEHAIAIAEVRIVAVTRDAVFVDPVAELRRHPLFPPSLIEAETIRTLRGEHQQRWQFGAWSTTRRQPREAESFEDQVGKVRVAAFLPPFERDPEFVDWARERDFAPEEALPALKGSDGESLPRLAAISCGEFVLVPPDRWPAQ